METTQEKASYCLGLETGKNLKSQFSDLDIIRALEGFRDGAQGINPKLKDDEIKQILAAIRYQVEMNQRELVTRIAAENKKRGEEFLLKNKQKEGVTTLMSGLQYKVLNSGSGPTAQFLDGVRIHYRSSYIDGKEFDTSYGREKAPIFAVNRVIPGWSEALQLMRAGDKWQIFVPSYLAYGEGGFESHIAPNTTLIFEIELLEINPEED